MATVDEHMRHAGGDSRSGPAAGLRHRGQDDLAEVIMIRPARPDRTGIFGSLVTRARGFASPRPQATSVRSTPRPPSSPALRVPAHRSTPRSPNDAA